MDILLGSDSVGGALVESLGANFTMIAIIFCACFILVLVILAYRSIKTANNELRLKEIQADARHIEEASKGIIRSDLRRSRVVMKDKERRYLRGIEKDNNVLSRRVLFLMNEVEEKSHRLELGSNEVFLSRKLDTIQNQERKVFRDSYRFQKR